MFRKRAIALAVLAAVSIGTVTALAAGTAKPHEPSSPSLVLSGLAGGSGSTLKPRPVPLTVSITGKGAVRVGTQQLACTRTCSRKFLYKHGAAVRLTPVLPTGAKFKWRGSCKGGRFACTLHMTKPRRSALPSSPPAWRRTRCRSDRQRRTGEAGC